MRVVVNLVGDAAHGKLAESRFVARPFLPGGEHNAYEFAFAAAVGGHDVELRGWLDRPTFDALAHEAGAAPQVELGARAPDARDLVIVPEGWRDPLEYARLLLSPARLALFVLAAPGLFGWPFSAAGWTPPDPLTVGLDELATPMHFRAMHATGYQLLTHSPGIVDAAQTAGVPCWFVGTGRPRPPRPAERTPRDLDAVGLMANRWSPFVAQIAAELDDLHVVCLPESPNHVVLEHFSRAKVLLWPSRVEGHATIPWEARSMGCVPVALSSNRFAVGLTPESGAIIVDEVAEIAPAVRSLMADEERWRALSERAMQTAPEEVAWEPYVRRVNEFIASITPPGPDRPALGTMGRSLETWLDERAESTQAALTELHGELERVSEDRQEIHAELARVREDRDALASRLGEVEAEEGRVRLDRDRLAAELAAARAQRDGLMAERDDLMARPAVKVALRMDRLARRHPGS